MTADSEHLAADLGDHRRIARELGQGGMPSVSMVSIRARRTRGKVRRMRALLHETEQDARIARAK